MKKFKWQHIQFADGSNPFICRTKKSFDYMNTKYILKPIKDGFWLAESKGVESLW